MRLQGYMVNESRAQKMDPFDVVEAIKKKCKMSLKAFRDDKAVWRGLRDSLGKAVYIAPKEHTRKSKNTANLYTIVIDNHPDWKKYPKRSESIICSNDYRGASPYGWTYIAFPVDGANYGICPQNDIWGSFDSTLGRTDLMGFNYSILTTIGEYELGINRKPNLDTYSDFKAYAKEFDKQWSITFNGDAGSVEVYERLERQMPWIRDYKDIGDFEKFMHFIFRPDPNKFTQTNNPNKIPQSSRREVWTDGPAYMIDEVWIRNNRNLFE